MLDRLAAWLFSLVRRARRVERRELAEFRRWVENTENLLHLSILVMLPVVLGVVTLLANVVEALPFLLFPPLASGSYTLFANPESEYASPRRFVGGMTAGALCGWIALETATRYWYQVTPEQFTADPGAVALGLFLTGAVTWALDIEEASAFSTALLIHVTGTTQILYVGSVLVSTGLVSGVFLLWRERFYEQRAQYLYGTVTADDHVLVPMRGEEADRTAMFGARLAAAHDAGKIVLLGLAKKEPDNSRGDSAESDQKWSGGERDVPHAEHRGTIESDVLASELEDQAAKIRTRVGVPCEVVVASGEPITTTIETARDTNCDLVVTPYEAEHGILSNFVRGMFNSRFDAIAFRSTREESRWKDVLVTVSRPGDTAHAMIDFATRLAGRTGHVSVCTCIGSEVERRRAEEQLATLVETAEGPIETRVSRADIDAFIDANAPTAELVMLGSSRDRSAASRFISPPTFERIRDIECDVAIVDRGA